EREPEALLKIDFRNAFNLIESGSFVRAACDFFQDCRSGRQWCYGTPSILLFNHEQVINSTRGVNKEPFGPSAFLLRSCCPGGEKSEDQSTNGTWMMGIIGTASQLESIWNMLL